MDLDKFTSLVGRLSNEFEESGVPASSYFLWAIKKQNEIYELPINSAPTLSAEHLNEQPLKRVQGFLKTLEKEMKEGKEIEFVLDKREIALSTESATVWDGLNLQHDAITAGIEPKRAIEISDILSIAWEDGGIDEVDRQILVMLADWLGDMNVYIRSEALKFGLPHEQNLAIIMGSNFTKLGEDGNPIKDANGKFLKGPNFIPPEEAMYANMFGGPQLDQESVEFEEKVQRVGMVMSVLEDPMDSILTGDDMDMLTDGSEDEVETW